MSEVAKKIQTIQSTYESEFIQKVNEYIAKYNMEIISSGAFERFGLACNWWAILQTK